MILGWLIFVPVLAIFLKRQLPGLLQEGNKKEIVCYFLVFAIALVLLAFKFAGWKGINIFNLWFYKFL